MTADSTLSIWRSNPSLAYAQWQEREATGSDRRPFATQSIVQHRAMFDRFNRYLVERGVSLDTFGSDLVDTFLMPGGVFAEDTTTRMRYAKLIERLCRHLNEIGLRRDNPASQLLIQMGWPDSEPLPAYLPESDDAKLQEHVQPCEGDSERATRNRAIVALLLASGITAAELQRIGRDDVRLETRNPYVSVVAHGPKLMRTVQLEPFGNEALGKWVTIRLADPDGGNLLFPGRNGRPLTVASLGNVVQDAMGAIGVRAEDMSPRILRNTDCRRRLLAGAADADICYRLGLVSTRTIERIRFTIKSKIVAT